MPFTMYLSFGVHVCFPEPLHRLQVSGDSLLFLLMPNPLHSLHDLATVPLPLHIVQSFLIKNVPRAPKEKLEVSPLPRQAQHILSSTVCIFSLRIATFRTYREVSTRLVFDGPSIGEGLINDRNTAKVTMQNQWTSGAADCILGGPY